MGGPAIGTKSKMAARKAAVWKTAVDLTANHRVPFVSSDLINEPDELEDDTLADGASTRRPSIPGNEKNEGNVVLQADYRQHMLLNALIFGAAGVPVGPTDATYLHTMKFQKTATGLYATLGIDKGGIKTADGSEKCEAWASAKPAKWMLTSVAGDKVRETFDLIAAGFFLTEDPAGWTYPAATDPSNGGGRTLVHARNTTRLNAMSGGALGAGDTFYPNKIEMSIDRNYGRDFSNGVDVNEPEPQGFQEVRLSLEFFNASAALIDFYRTAYRARTLLKASVAYAHTLFAGGATPYSRTFYFPKLLCVKAPMTVPGAGNIPYRVDFTAHLATAAPTGFTALMVEEISQVWVNEISTDALA